MANLHIRSILMSAILLGVIFSNSISENTADLSESEQLKQVIFDFGDNNSSNYELFLTNTLSDDFENLNGLKIHATTIDPNGAIIAAGHVSSSKTITTNSGDFSTTVCQIFLMKINLNDEIEWFRNVTREEYTSWGGDCYTQTYNQATLSDHNNHNVRWVSKILVTDIGEIYLLEHMPLYHFDSM